MYFKYIVVSILTTLIVRNVFTGNFHIKLDRLVCTGSGEITINVCMIKFRNRTMRTFEFNANFTPTSNITIDYEIFYRFGHTFKSFGVKGSEDYCAYVNGGKSSYLLNAVIPLLRRYNIAPLQKCPIDHYILKNLFWNIDSMILPPVIPEGIYKMETSIYSEYCRLNITAWTEVKPTNRLHVFAMG